MSALKDAANGAFDAARTVTEKTFEGFDESNAYETAEDGGKNAAWVAGHLAVTYELVLTEIAGQPATLDSAFQERFGRGSKPPKAPEDAPSSASGFSELMHEFEDRRRAVQDWFNSLADVDAGRELPEQYRMFGGTVAGMMGALGAHENYHAGQLATVRRKLGMEPIFG